MKGLSMKLKLTFAGLLILALQFNAYSQSQSFAFSATLTFSEEVQEGFNPEGRLFLFLCENPQVEPKNQTWPMPWVKNHIFAINMSDLSAEGPTRLDAFIDWTKTPEWNLDEIPQGEYYLQVLWDQSTEEAGLNAPGNLFSTKQKVILDQQVGLEITVDQRTDTLSVDDHPLVRLVEMKSDTLSKWWDKDMILKASVLLPAGYKKGKNYPIRYNVAGYGGRYNRVNRLVSNEEFMTWWNSKDAPRVINVFLDGSGPFGDSYQMDSENSGPFGEALIKELIPHIESEYRGTSSPDTRFVDGCSTGGWVSLGLQLYYPDIFNGAFSYSPDAVEFENYQLVNIYKDKNAFVNEFGYTRPVMRNVSGEPLMSYEKFLKYENVLGASNTYVNSGGQLGAHAALYGPRGEDGLPVALIDPVTGDINQEVAEHWKKYDFKLYAQEHWEELGPKIDGKIYIWMGDMDHFYLNTATRAFSAYLETTENPKSDAEILFSPMEGHCSKFSHRDVLERIHERINN